MKKTLNIKLEEQNLLIESKKNNMEPNLRMAYGCYYFFDRSYVYFARHFIHKS